MKHHTVRVDSAGPLQWLSVLTSALGAAECSTPRLRSCSCKNSVSGPFSLVPIFRSRRDPPPTEDTT
jgi:hypothetical protein